MTTSTTLQRYWVVSSCFHEDLIKECEAMLKNGWTLQGGVSTSLLSGSVFRFSQAFVKTENVQVPPMP